MRPLQGPPQSHAQRGCQDDGHRAVEQGSGDLQRQSRRRHGSGETTHQQAVIRKGLEEIENVVGHAAQSRRDGAAPVSRRLPVLHGQTGYHTHNALGEEGDPALRSVGRVGQVIDGGTQAGGKTAHRPQQQAGQAAHDVGQSKGGAAADGDGHGDPQIVADKHQCRHHAQHGQLIDILLIPDDV